MSVTVWSTRDPLDPGFERAWNERLSRIPQAHFAIRLDFLAHEARSGEHAMAILIDDGTAHGILVMRDAGAEWISGWPWRWQAMIEEGAGAVGMSADQADWLWDHARRIAGQRRLRFFLPVPAHDGSSFVAASTYVQSLELAEEEMWKRLDGAKRRMVKRATGQGYTVVEAQELAHLRAFADLPRDGRRGAAAPALIGADGLPEPGEGWREWERPWMSLLVAVREGVVEAGSGFGFREGCTVDYRTNASTGAGKRDGANVLLAWEALRRGRERGFRWLNWGGATRFKQEFGGERLSIVCRLGGGTAWALPNMLTASTRRARTQVGSMLRARAAAKAARTDAKPKAAPAPAGASLSCWKSRDALAPDFERAWRELTAATPMAHFALDLGYLSWEARHGRHATAVIAEEKGRRGVLVLREGRGALYCGWPWRWQAVMRGGDEASPEIAPKDAEWLFAQARRLAGGRRLKFYAPVPPPAGTPGFEAGATILQRLVATREEMLASMHGAKRRMVKRAIQEGYEVSEGRTPEQYRAFGEIQRATEARRGQIAAEPMPESPEPGESWREWELPWMWLLVATKAGVVESGLGDGVGLGTVLEGRTGGSTAEARKAGAFALLCLEEAVRGHQRGYRWLNHGGDTPFKREMAGALGTRLTMYCWLAGGAAWTLANRSEAWMTRARTGVPAWVRALREREKGAR